MGGVYGHTKEEQFHRSLQKVQRMSGGVQFTSVVQPGEYTAMEYLNLLVSTIITMLVLVGSFKLVSPQCKC